MMFVIDSQEQKKRNDKRSRLLMLADECRQALRDSAFGMKPHVDSFEPETRAILTGQAGPRMDSNDPLFRIKHPNAYAIKKLVEMFKADSAFAARWDAGETRIFELMLQYTVQALVPSLYTPDQAAAIFPIDTSIPSGASTIQKIRIEDNDDEDNLGHVEHVGDDILMVEISGDNDVYRLASCARGVQYSLDELEEAAFAGGQIRTEKLMALDRRAMAIFERIAFQGFAPAGITGTYNDANIALTAVVTGTWATATADQIMGDLEALIEANVTANGGNYRPTRLAVPQSLWRYLNLERANTDRTVREMLMAREPQLSVVVCNRANLYDAAGTGPRLMAFYNDPQHINVAVARSFTLEPPEKHGLSYRIVGRQKLGGAVASIPLTSNYMDGC